jgi:hypothetical protein
MVVENFLINSYLKNNTMKIKALFMAIFFVAAIFGGCEKSNNIVQEDDYSTIKKKPVDRPFKMTGHTIPGGGEGGEECGPGNEGETVEYIGVGKATHMGNITYSGTNCILDLCLDSDIIVVAANGDELYMVNTNYSICQTFFEYPTLVYEGPGIIDGGTGRFENASGDVYWIVTLNLEEGNATIKTVGTITY